MSSSKPRDRRLDYQVSLTLTPEAIPTIRNAVRARLTSSDTGRAHTHDACLVVTELLDNVLRHTPTGFAELTVTTMADDVTPALDHLLITVFDRDPNPLRVCPVSRRPNWSRDRGRGLTHVSLTAWSWGVRQITHPEHGPGKEVWVLLRSPGPGPLAG
ncbi:ATP-binding protein [Allostreptomyces psammosilenae]|uniref:Anti-sigma regulatory factor (Ser/Thr protein kinase) n=1 Tax=Allostreptomyces psammosilenae TaxID=1892865 RepID=A0A852ZRD7_9ACTN|nr:hypothetical protein [Allostreptomyces psammosilenae]NYI04047.1 anti-sigma regulatory factor (Ser/Thr protein kinase) [Allostreptomyces psammosilenae]